MESNNIVFGGMLYDKDYKIKWRIVIKEINDEFHVEENTKYSLFPSPLAKGNTPGEALNNFLAVEADLINNLQK